MCYENQKIEKQNITSYLSGITILKIENSMYVVIFLDYPTAVFLCMNALRIIKPYNLQCKA